VFQLQLHINKTPDPFNTKINNYKVGKTSPITPIEAKIISVSGYLF